METGYNIDTLKQHEKYKYIKPYYKTMDIINRAHKLTQEHYEFMRSENIERIYFNARLDIIDFSQVPNNVYSLVIDCSDNYFDTALIPSSITQLFIRTRFNINGLPSQIKCLDLEFIKFKTYNCDSCTNLPSNLEYLRLNGYITIPLDTLPQGLKYLEIIKTSFKDTLDNLPPCLEYLEIISKYMNSQQNLTQLPESLTTLILDIKDAKYNIFALPKLPSNLKNLCLLSHYVDFDVIFPDSLESLEIKTNRYNLANDIIPNLPANLQHIKLKRILNKADLDAIKSDIYKYAPNAICTFFTD